MSLGYEVVSPVGEAPDASPSNNANLGAAPLNSQSGKKLDLV